MEMVISFLFGSALVFFIFLGLLTAGVLYLACSTNVVENIKKIFKENPPVVTLPPSEEPKLPESQPTKELLPPPVKAPISTQVPVEHANVTPIVKPPQTPQKVEINILVPQVDVKRTIQPLLPTPPKQNISTSYTPPISFSSRVTAFQIYHKALEISCLSPEDIEALEYMEDDDPRIKILKRSCQTVYSQLTGHDAIIPPELLPPYPIWVKVAFGNTTNLFSYFLGNISEHDIYTNQEVIVYARSKKRGAPKRKRATIKYISSAFEPPPDKAKSPITLLVKGVYMASKNGKKFHDPCCRQMENVSNDEAIWFQSEEEALFKGFDPCKNCLM